LAPQMRKMSFSPRGRAQATEKDADVRSLRFDQTVAVAPTLYRFGRQWRTPTCIKYIHSRCDEEKIGELSTPRCRRGSVDDLSERIDLDIYQFLESTLSLIESAGGATSTDGSSNRGALLWSRGGPQRLSRCGSGAAQRQRARGG